MKKQLIPIEIIILITAVPICMAQLSVYKRTKSGVSPAVISDLEKSVTQAYKDKQAEAFKPETLPLLMSMQSKAQTP